MADAGPVRIRPEAPADHDAIARLVTAAFGSGAEARLVERIRSSPEYVAEMALVAELDGDVVGHVVISGATVRSDHGDRPIVMLSPLAVDPAHQRQGIGGALVDAVTEIADRRGEPYVVLEGSPRYYPRLGFTSAAARGLTLPLPDWAPAEAAQVKLLSSDDPDDPRLRGVVVYPPAFDGLSDPT